MTKLPCQILEAIPVVRLELGAAPEGPAAHITDMSLLEVLVGAVVGRRSHSSRPPFSPPLKIYME